MLEKFIEENLIANESFVKTTAKDVYNRYLIFCEHYKIFPIGKKKFYFHMESIGVAREIVNGRKYFRGWYLVRCKY